MPLLPWQHLPEPEAGGVQMGLSMQMQPQLLAGLVQLHLRLLEQLLWMLPGLLLPALLCLQQRQGGWKGHGCGHAWLPARAHGAAAAACGSDHLPEMSVGVGVGGLMLGRPKHQAVLEQLVHLHQVPDWLLHLLVIWQQQTSPARPFQTHAACHPCIQHFQISTVFVAAHGMAYVA